MKSRADLCTSLAAMLCMSPALVAQSAGSVAAIETAAKYEAYRQLLRQGWQACYLNDADYREQDSAAERLYFDLYNQAYASRSDPGAKKFFPQMKQHADAVVAAPQEYDLKATCDAVLAEIKAFHPNVSVPSLASAAEWCGKWKKHSCWCKTPNMNPPASACPSPPKFTTETWTPNANWLKHQGQYQSLELPDMSIRTNYCYGRGMDGIMMVPKQLCPSGHPIRIRQFVMTSCPGKNCGTNKQTTCKSRPVEDLDYWYLDECNGNLGYYTPDEPFPSDDPTANVPNGPPYELQFYDFLMCDTTQVIDVFQWQRKGKTPAVETCEVPVGGAIALKTEGTYFNVFRVNVDPSMGGSPRNIADVVCNIHNAKDFLDDKGLNAIQALAGCGHGR